MLVIGSIVLLAVFWVWALFFAPRESINKVRDRDWAVRAETICVSYSDRFTALDDRASVDLVVRADLVDESTDLLGEMLDEVVAVSPADDKGKAIVPDWEADYRTLLQDRYNYADRLRAGENVPFSETPVEGVPITERIERFAADNEIDSCAPPRGSVL